MQEPLLHIQHLSVDFVAREATTQAVKDLTLAVHPGEIVALVGESGSGKSVTSLSILQLLPVPPARYRSGAILFRHNNRVQDLLQLNTEELQAIRGHRIAMIFQEPMTSLNPLMTCGRQVMEALQRHKQLGKAQAKTETIAWLEKVKLPQPQVIFHRYPHQLSGGQKQRVMIAMAMCCAPSLLICDEPTTALDVTVQKTILDLIRELQQQQGMGVIFITHDLGVVAQIADRVAIMYKGEIVEQDTVQRIFRQPQHPYTRALIACRPALHPRGERLPVISDYLGQDGSEKPYVKAAPAAARPAAEEVLLRVENLSVRYPGKTGWLGKPLHFTTAVDNVSFQIEKGATMGLVGESGCGKTTLGRTLLRLIEPSSGRIVFNNRDLTTLGRKAFTAFRKDVQLVFQDPYSSLNPRLTVQDALAEPMQVFGLQPSARERRKKVAELLERVNLSADWANRYPHQFSGGQRQRIVIARALALNPSFLVCDESVSALDVSVQAQVLNLLNDLKRDLNLTMLFISHDLSVVRYMSDHIMVMQAGRIVETGTAEDVYRHPRSAYTQKLLASIPQLQP